MYAVAILPVIARYEAIFFVFEIALGTNLSNDVLLKNEIKNGEHTF
jgi:hypothetical protein